MNDDPAKFRDPKIQEKGSNSSGGIGKWIGIALAMLVLLLLLLWLFGAFSDEEPVDANEPDAITAPAD